MYVVKRQDFVLEVAFLGWRMGGPPWLAAGRFSVAGCKGIRWVCSMQSHADRLTVWGKLVPVGIAPLRCLRA